MGKIIDEKGPLTFMVKLEDGRIWKRHADHIKHCLAANEHMNSHYCVPGDSSAAKSPPVYSSNDIRGTPCAAIVSNLGNMCDIPVSMDISDVDTPNFQDTSTVATSNIVPASDGISTLTYTHTMNNVNKR